MATINTPQLTNTNISDTYLGVLHARGVPLSASGQTKIHDGSGEVSALSLGRQNNGMSVTGLLSGNAIIKGNSLVANELTMPRIDTGTSGDIVIRSGTGTLALSGFNDVFNAVYSSLPDGTYVNPRITVSNGLITGIESRGAVRNYVWRVVPDALGSPPPFGAAATSGGITGIEGIVQTASIQTFLQSVWPLGVAAATTGAVGDIAIVTQYGKKTTSQSKISYTFYDRETYISSAVFKRTGSSNLGTDWTNNGYAHTATTSTTTFSATNYLIS